MLYNFEEVLSFLPHRDPFLFIDSIKSVELCDGHSKAIESFNAKEFIGSKVTALYKAKKELDIFKGHFPGNPVLPGVIQIEMMAQACPFMFLHSFKNEIKEYDLVVSLLTVDETKFKKPVLPEEDLILDVELLTARRNFLSYSGCLLNSQGEFKSETKVMASISFTKKEIKEK